MKKILLAFLLMISLNSFSQSCEERETKLLQAVGGFSSALLYNTYGVIGSIADAYVKEAYNATMVNNLMTAQKTLADNLVNMLNNLVKDSVLKQTDKDYAMGVITILNGLKEQASLLQQFATADGEKKQAAYEEKRKKNWTAICKLMGIKE